MAFESDSERNCYQILLSRQVVGNIYAAANAQLPTSSTHKRTRKRTWLNTRFESEETKKLQRWHICWPAWRTTSSLRRRTSTTGPSSSFIRSPVGSAWSGPPSGLLLSTLETLSGAIFWGEILDKKFWLQLFMKCLSCDFSGIDDAYAKDYCWVHGSNYIPQEYQVYNESSNRSTSLQMMFQGAYEM